MSDNLTALCALSANHGWYCSEHMLGERNYDRLGPIGLVLRLISNRKIIRLALTAAVALGITAGVSRVRHPCPYPILTRV